MKQLHKHKAEIMLLSFVATHPTHCTYWLMTVYLIEAGS